MNAEEIIETLGLEPHPEGGYFAETWRHEPASGGRGSGTAIFYLLKEGQSSGWHRIDATEIWHFYAGAPLELQLQLQSPERGHQSHRLGPNLEQGERPQLIVHPGVWQSARPCGEWTLAGCTVSPAFLFEGFELAAPGWSP